MADQAPNTKVVPWKDAMGYASSKLPLLITDKVKANQELGFAFMAIESSTALQGCTQQSIIDAVLMIGRTGLTLNPVFKFAYLIPRKGKCILDIGYQGMAKVLVDAEAAKTIDAFVIYKDEFTKGKFRFDHVTQECFYDPIFPETELEQNKRMTFNNLHGVLTIATLFDGSKHKHFLPRWKVEKAYRISEGKSEKMPWGNFWDEMVKKTGIRAHFKVLPKGKVTDQLAAVMELEDQNNAVDFSKGNPEGKKSMADDILTTKEPAGDPIFTDIEEEKEDTAAESPATLSETVKTAITGIQDADALVTYANNLTHLHQSGEFIALVSNHLTKLSKKKAPTLKLIF